MELKEIMSHPIVRLPKRQSEDGSFRKYLNNLLDEYFQIVEATDFPIGINKEVKVQQLKLLIKGIKDTLKAHYRGSPFDAYRRLRDGIKKSEINSMWVAIKFQPKFSFFRLRIKNSNYPLTRNELHHIPFNLRGKVETQRFSIPGFPSLYLSNSVYVAWEELGRPNLEMLQGARFVNKQDVLCLDLTNRKYLGNYDANVSNNQLIADVFMWPLIAACSIKVKHREDSFKPEYIIPQLLLQWIRNNHEIDGIRFSSTHIDLNEMKSEGDFYNLVIPVTDNKETGYCTAISSKFQMSDVLSWQINQFSSGASGVIPTYSGKDGINPNVKKIELIKNKPYPYEFSPLSNFELQLNMMKVTDIDFC